MDAEKGETWIWHGIDVALDEVVFFGVEEQVLATERDNFWDLKWYKICKSNGISTFRMVTLTVEQPVNWAKISDCSPPHVNTYFVDTPFLSLPRIVTGWSASSGVSTNFFA